MFINSGPDEKLHVTWLTHISCYVWHACTERKRCGLSRFDWIWFQLPLTSSAILMGWRSSLRQMMLGVGEPLAAQRKVTVLCSRTIMSVLVCESMISGGTADKVTVEVWNITGNVSRKFISVNGEAGSYRAIWAKYDARYFCTPRTFITRKIHAMNVVLIGNLHWVQDRCMKILFIFWGYFSHRSQWLKSSFCLYLFRP